MIIWTGWGILAVGVAVLAFVVVAGLGQLVSGDAEELPLFVPPLGLALAGVGNYLLGRRLNRNADRVLLDPESGAAVTVRRRHTLFFIRVEHWGIALLALAPITLVGGIIGLVGR